MEYAKKTLQFSKVHYEDMSDACIVNEAESMCLKNGTLPDEFIEKINSFDTGCEKTLKELSYELNQVVEISKWFRCKKAVGQHVILRHLVINANIRAIKTVTAKMI